MARLLLLLTLISALVVSVQSQTAYGCFSSLPDSSDPESYEFQSYSHCQSQCSAKGLSIFALYGGSYCYCADELPPASNKVSDSNCNVACTGYGSDTCGGDDSYEVFYVGALNALSTAGGSSSGSAASSSTKSDASGSSTKTDSSSKTSGAASGSSSTSSPSSQTSGGSGSASTAAASKTTGSSGAAASSNTAGSSNSGETSSPSSSGSGSGSSSPSPTSSSHSGSSNKNKKSSSISKGAIAGIVVGVVVGLAIIGGIVFFIFSRRRQSEKYKPYSPEMAASGFKDPLGPVPPMGGYVDQRLNPSMLGERRLSEGSLADARDYSRKILRVTNPDDS